MNDLWDTLSGPDREDWLVLALSHWCQVDSQAAFALVRDWSSSDTPPGRSYWAAFTARPFVLRTWARIDSAAVNAFIAEDPFSTDHGAILELDARNNSSQILPFLATNPNSIEAATLIRTFAREYPEEAKRAFLEGSISVDGFTVELARALVSANAIKAMEWARALEDQNKRNSMLFEVFRAWSQRDPTAALAQAVTVPSNDDDDYPSRELSATVSEFAKQDPKQAFKWIREYSAQSPKEAGTLIAISTGPALLGTTAEEAITSLSYLFPDVVKPGTTRTSTQHQETDISNQLRSAINSLRDARWPNDNPNEVAHSLASQPQGILRDQLLGLAIDRWALSDPAGAVAMVHDIAPNADLDNLIDVMLAVRYTHNFAQGLALAQVFPPDTRDPWVRNLIVRGVNEDPEALGRAMIEAGDTVSAFEVEWFTRQWAKDDLPSTTDWLGTLDNESLREVGMNVLREEHGHE